MNKRNIDVLEHIIRYCDEIDEAADHFGKSIDALKSSSVYKNAVAMCILQIGEVVGHLSDEFKAAYPKMPWLDMRRMRNIAAHQYHKFDDDTLWETITEDVPVLREYCEGIISQYMVLEQEVFMEPDDGPELTF